MRVLETNKESHRIQKNEDKYIRATAPGSALVKQVDPADTAVLRKHASYTDTPEWQAVLLIVGSPGFSKSTLLSNFLLYVSERKLQGREGEIREQQIGIHAFGRPATYNPGDDNIVRNYARILRQRLEDFYAEEGSKERLRIVIPRGSYIPQFEPHPLPEPTHAPLAHLPQKPSPLPDLPQDAETEKPSIRQPFWRTKTSRGTAIAALVLLVVAGAYAARRSWAVLHPDIYTEFWNEVLSAHRPTVVVLADSGFGMLQDFTGARIRLHEYASGDTSVLAEAFARRYPSAPFGVNRFKNLTSTADVRSLMDLVVQPQFATAAPLVRYAQDVHMDDLSDANAIIVGGPRANPWVELYEPASDFRLDIPDEFRGAQLDARVVINKSPHQGEAASYSNGFHADEGYVNHTILSFLPSLDGHGHVLLFQGGNMGATQAAADFATDRLSMEPILKRARRADGSLRPFEVLFETRVVGASSPKAEVIIIHYK